MGPNWKLTEEDVLAFPLDRLAVEVLRDWVETEQWNLYNWLNSVGQSFSKRPDVQRALSEALNWLVSHGLIARGLPGQTSTDGAFATRLGRKVLAEGLESVRAYERLEVDLHPRLARTRTQFLLGEYELAAFAAMREVEIRVRELAGAEDSLVGVKLMQRSLREGGPLANASLDPGEQVGLMNLFSGAIALFKNPPSHRQIDYKNPTEAAEVVLLADLLLRLLERRAQGRN
jgi:uncharacterized protein (TIGR02391 family)